MKRVQTISFILLFMLFSYNTLKAQHTAKAKTTVATPEEDDYDVKYVKLEIEATNLSTAISGKATTHAIVTAASMPVYAFELSAQLAIDSVKLNGILYTVASNDSIRKITLATPFTQGNSLVAEIWYHGQPIGGNNFFTNGLLNQSDAGIPVQVTHTVSAAYHSKDWWPCKQSLSDKIDSADIWITVPTGLKVAGNGLLQNITVISSSQNRYEWALRSPVDYYLLSFSVAPYDEYNYYMHFANGDSMLIQNFIYQDPSVLQQHKDELDSIENIINYFSALFGKYSFYKEKFGLCQTPLSGGMENQTMVSLGSLDITLIAHELAHQWWGDYVTCHSLADMWLNEGWATYCEHLFLERFHGNTAARNFRDEMQNRIVGVSSGSVLVSDTTDENRIYDGRLTYYKGAFLAHMLRYLIDDDSKFFQIAATYQQQFANATATTEDLKNIATQISGVQLDTFFRQWYAGEGFPAYSLRWYQDVNGNVILKLTQNASKPSSVALFKMPLQIQFLTANGEDTIVSFYNSQSIEYFNAYWSKTINTIKIDPDNHIINRVSSIIKDATLDATSVSKNKLLVYPNPAADGWYIDQLKEEATIKLIHINGGVIWQTVTKDDRIFVPADGLTTGNYILQIRFKDKPVVNYTVIHK